MITKEQFANIRIGQVVTFVDGPGWTPTNPTEIGYIIEKSETRFGYKVRVRILESVYDRAGDDEYANHLKDPINDRGIGAYLFDVDADPMTGEIKDPVTVFGL